VAVSGFRNGSCGCGSTGRRGLFVPACPSLPAEGHAACVRAGQHSQHRAVCVCICVCVCGCRRCHCRPLMRTTVVKWDGPGAMVTVLPERLRALCGVPARGPANACMMHRIGRAGLDPYPDRSFDRQPAAFPCRCSSTPALARPRGRPVRLAGSCG
jgi:hypothetical protein